MNSPLCRSGQHGVCRAADNARSSSKRHFSAAQGVVDLRLDGSGDTGGGRILSLTIGTTVRAFVV
jgi:hypothetical protein